MSQVLMTLCDATPRCTMCGRECRRNYGGTSRTQNTRICTGCNRAHTICSCRKLKGWRK